MPSEAAPALPDASVASDEAQVLLKACMDAMINPQVLLAAVRDTGGRVVDFIFRSANRATLSYLQLSEDELIGGSALKIIPNRDGPGLLSRLAECLEDGEAVSIDDFPYFNEELSEVRRHDIRAAKAGADLLAMTWSDVTERSQFVERIAASERKFRRSMDNAAVGMCLITPEGRFEDVNEALCQLLGYGADSLKEKTWQDFNAPGYEEDDWKYVNAVLDGSLDSYRRLKRYIHADGHLIWVDLSVSCVRDEAGDVEYFISQLTDITALVEADERNRILAEQLQRQTDHVAASEERYRLLAENAGDLVCHTREDNKGRHKIVWISPNVEAVLGAPPEHWIGRVLLELVIPEDAPAHAARWKKVKGGGGVSQRVRMSSIDGVVHWFHARIKPYYDAEGHRDGAVIAAHLVDDEVAAEQAVEEARRQQAKADERFRRLIDHAAVAMCLFSAEGRVEEVNDALCQFFGYDAETLKQKTWRDVTAPQYIKETATKVIDILHGRIDSFRMITQYVHADGHLIWTDHSVGCIRDEHGRVENFISQIADITAQVEADERNRILNQQLQQQTDLLKSELASAATYMASIMPSDLQGPVTVSSRYLPSQALGGDCIDYYWIDDDHLLIKLIDVSGHGLEPALLAVSVHNLMRSGSLTRETLLSPEAVLTELNRRFPMSRHNDHYFTMWYGIYEASTRTLRYASAGAPPALAFNPATGAAVAVTELSTKASPVGVFEDTEFTSHTYQVPPGCRMLIYSDGASEITLGDGQQLTGAAFKDLTTQVAASSDWSLDDLIDELRALTPSAGFEDDCSLIQLTFPRFEKFAGAMPLDTIRVEIDGLCDPLGAIQKALDAFWSTHPHVPDDVRMQMTIAIAEVGANIVEHTGRGRPLRIRMNAALVDDQVCVDFTDDGLPVEIDLASVAMPDPMAECGRGLAMAQALLDQLAYRCDDSGNHWILVSKRFD